MGKVKHIAAFSFHDTKGNTIELMEKIVPDLTKIFDRVVAGVTPLTYETQKEKIDHLAKNKFLVMAFNKPGTQMGQHWLRAMRKAIEISAPTDMIHYCTPDRLEVAMLRHKGQFAKDMAAEKTDGGPILYERSDWAWSTHPKNYYEIEMLGKRFTKTMWGREIDVFWNDLGIKAELLEKTIKKVKTKDFTVEAEIAYYLQDKLKIKKVDWLEWEDAMVLGVDAEKLKAEREGSDEENRKRFNYVLSSLEWILKHPVKTKSSGRR